MVRIRCSKCSNVLEFDISVSTILGTVHIGPYRLLKCPACGRRSLFNIYSSVKEPITWPPSEERKKKVDDKLTEEELEKKRIEDSKYETA